MHAVSLIPLCSFLKRLCALNNCLHFMKTIYTLIGICYIFLLQSAFQTVELSASAEVNTNDPDLFVIGENALSVSLTVLCSSLATLKAIMSFSRSFKNTWHPVSSSYKKATLLLLTCINCCVSFKVTGNLTVLWRFIWPSFGSKET